MTAPVPHQAIYRRWRAQTFSEIVGQEAVVETLRNAVRSNRVAHAILFVGPRGTGKTSLARILAKAINCTNLRDGDPCDACPSCVSIREGRALDLVEIDAASNRGIDAIRDLRERINYAPTDLRRKVYILDEAHQITKDAWNALLKSLEEPPEFVVFMFASTHPQEFPPAILSRLQRYDVRRLTVPEIEGKLTRILAADGRTVEPDAVRLIARLAGGGMRDAESMLDQLLSTADDRLDEARVRDLLGLADAEALDGFVEALMAADVGRGVAILDGLEDRGRDPRAFLDQLIETVRRSLVDGLAQGERDRTAALAEAARRLAAIDPNRAGIGGLRLQLELALFAGLGRGPRTIPASQASVAPPSGAARSAGPSTPTAEPPAPAAEQGAPAEHPAPAVGSPAAPAGRPAPTTEPAARAVEPGAPTTEPSVRAPRPPAPADTGPPEPAAPRAEPGAPAGSELEGLVRRWPELVASVRPATRAVISECRPLAIDGNQVTLGFPEAKAFLKDVAERKRTDLEAAVGAFLGRSVAVRCVATNIDLVPSTPDDESAFVMAEARRIFADDLADIGEVT